VASPNFFELSKDFGFHLKELIDCLVAAGVEGFTLRNE
jgi:hypothetical protein